MKKLLVAATVLLAVILLAAPAVVGMVTESRVRERVAVIDDGGFLTAAVLAFDRRWFGSTAIIELGLGEQYPPPNAAAGAPPSRGVVRVDFAHGPVAVLDGVHFGWSKMVARPDPTVPGIGELQQQLAIPYLFEFRARTGFGGDMRFDADVPPIDFPVDEARLVFSGAFLDGRFANERLVADARIGAAEFTSPTGTFAVDNVQASGDYEIRSQYLTVGEGVLSVAGVRIVDGMRAGTPVFEATNMRVTGDSTLNDTGTMLDMVVSYDLERVRIEESELTDGRLGMAVRNIDVAALEAYNDAVRDLAGTPTADDPRALLASIAPQIERALASSPSLTIDPLTFRLDGEPLDARISLAANPARLPPAGALTFDNPLLVLGFINADAVLEASKALALRLATLTAQMQLGSDPSMPPDQREYMAEAQAGLILTLLTTQGVLVDAADGYRATLQLADGVLTLNGQPLPFGLGAR